MSRWSNWSTGCPSRHPRRARRGRPPTYPDRLFLQALVIMIVRHLHTVHELLSVLAQPTPEMQTLRSLADRGRPLSDPPHLGAALAGHPGDPAGPDWLSGPGAGRPDPALGDGVGGRRPSTARCCAPAAASGTRRTARPASSRTRRLIPRRTGPSRAGTAGSTAGSCTWSRPSRRLDSAGGRPDRRERGR